MLEFSAQINAASLGAQPQFLSSLTSTPIITSAMSNMAGITSQLITNAQGQVGARNCYSVCVMLCCQGLLCLPVDVKHIATGAPEQESCQRRKI